MYDPDDRLSEEIQRPRPTEEPRLVEYDWVHQPKPEKRVPIELIEAILADLEEDADEAPALPN